MDGRPSPWMEVPYSLNSPISSILCIGYSGYLQFQSRFADFNHEKVTAFEDSGFVNFNFVNQGREARGMGQESGKQHADRGREWQRENRRSIYE